MKKGLVITPEDFNGVDWIAKMKELGLNTLGLHSGGGASHDVTAVLGDYAKEEFRKRVADAGLDLEYEDHAADSLLDRSLFKTHPEYFPMHCISGERREKGNWCISNPDVAELLASNAVNLAEKLVPSTHRHYFWSCDFPGGWCHCPACSAMTVSDQNLASVNAMAKALREADPQAELAYLAYLNHYEMPEKVEPAEGVFLEFAPITRCPRHAINDPDCAVNRVYWNSLKRHLNLFAPEKLIFWNTGWMFLFTVIIKTGSKAGTVPRCPETRYRSIYEPRYQPVHNLCRLYGRRIFPELRRRGTADLCRCPE